MMTLKQRVVLIRHDNDPQDDRVVSWLRSSDLEPEFRCPFRGDELGTVDGSVAASIVYGGPFNVFEEDRHTFLHDEHRWIEDCMAANIPLLGICQGAQSIARVLGAQVGPTDPEIYEFGYYPLTPTEVGRGIVPDGLVVAESHFHTFEIPEGAERLASSALYPNQAMRYGDHTFAFQFHAEATPTGFRRWQTRNASYYGKNGAQSRDEQDRCMAEHDDAQHQWFMGFLDGFLVDAISRAA